MAEDGTENIQLANALKRQKELQDTIKNATNTIKSAMQELEKIRQFIDLYRSFSPHRDSGIARGSDSASLPSKKLKGRAHGQTQSVFEALALDILRDIGRPMKSGEFVEEFRKRGQPLGGNEVRTAWNRLWQARKAALLTHDVQLGYWLPGEPITEEMRARALEAGKRKQRSGPSLRELTKGKRKGPPAALTPEQVGEAEQLLLSGKSRKEVCELFGGISMATLAGYVGRTDEFLARHPGVVIPKRPPPRPHWRPGWKPPGRPRSLTPEQDREIVEFRACGKTVEEIGKIMGVGRATVYAALKRAQDENERTNEIRTPTDSN
jgi:transcriptional regulator